MIAFEFYYFMLHTSSDKENLFKPFESTLDKDFTTVLYVNLNDKRCTECIYVLNVISLTKIITVAHIPSSSSFSMLFGQ